MTRRGVAIEVGATVIVIIAVLRCVVLFAPRVVFDIDPALEPSVLAGLGPPGSLLLDGLLLLASGVVLCAGGRVSWLMLILAAAPVPALLFHCFGADGLRHAAAGMTWPAAVAAALALASASVDSARRRRLAALLLAVLAPLMARSLLQIEIPALGYTGSEHAETLAQYDAQRDAMLADHGWAPDSASARIFERRLQQAQPTAWFVTTNVLATFVAVGVLIAGGVLLTGRRCGLSPGALGAVAIVGAVLLGLLVTTGSKGAFGGLLVGVLVLFVLAWPRCTAWLGGRTRWLLVALPMVVIGGVVARSALLPESFAGELSLLFRGQYLQAAVDITVDHPLAGVGPAGFQEAYVAHRSPRSPEEVASAHGAYVDWMAMLGLGGLAWIGVASGLIGRAAVEGEEVDGDPPRWFPVQALAAGAIAVGAGIALELSTLGPADAGGRLAGLGGYVLLALGLARVLCRLPAPALRAVLAAAAILVLAHGQIEMTFVRPGSVVWAWCLLGIAAGGVGGTRRAALVGGAGSVVFAIVVMAAFWWPARQEQTVLIRAAQKLWPVAQLRQLAAQATDVAGGQRLRSGALALGATENDLTPAGFGPFMRRLERTTRTAAIAVLAESDRPESRRQSARQNLLAAVGAGDDGPPFLLRAIERLQPAVDRDDLSAIAMSCSAHLELIGHDAGDHTRQATDLARRLTELDPNGLTAWLRFADLQWDCGRAENARLAYDRVLIIDANYELDPLKQLPGHDRQRALSRSSRGQEVGG